MKLFRLIGQFLYQCIGIVILLVIAIPIAAAITPFIVIGLLEEVFK